MKRGFTLIELLVVIAIIAILAAILFPVFARAREKARQSSCLSNIKQLTLGAHMYAQDYDESILPACISTATATSLIWTGLVQPYVKNDQIFACPSSSTHRLTYYFDGNRGWPSVGENWFFSVSDYGRRAMGDVQYPAQAAQFADTLNGDTNAGYRGYEFRGDDNRTCDTAEFMQARHNEGVNIGFLDGHAKWMSRGAINGRQGLDTSWPM